jgi:hypothetical protein
MWRTNAAERRFLLWGVFVVASHADARAALVRLAALGRRFALFQMPKRPVRERQRVHRSDRLRRRFDFLRFSSASQVGTVT